MRQVAGAKWNSTIKCWLVPDTPANRQRCGLLPRFLDMDGQHEIVGGLREKLVNTYNKLLLKAYAATTIKNYCLHLKEYFFAMRDGSDIDMVTRDAIEKYLLHRTCCKQGSEADLNCHINAIKFYYEQVLGKERMLFALPRPRRPLQLPKVLGETELEFLFMAVLNIKHKAVLLTAFSWGIRISEVVNLKISDIDSDRMQVSVERSKGKKDRYVMLSHLLLDVLRSCLKTQRPRQLKG